MNKIVAIENRLSNPPDVRKLANSNIYMHKYIICIANYAYFVNRIWWLRTENSYERLVLHE
jgi:hypothetical protein